MRLQDFSPVAELRPEGVEGARVPWLSGPEDSWLNRACVAGRRGPGDPGLLTRKAIARLRAADLVLYDALIDDRMLRYARQGAALLRRQARRPPRDVAAGDSRADDPRRAARPARRPAEGRRSVRVRPRRRRSAGAAAGGRAVRRRARRHERDRGAGVGRHSGDPPRRLVGVPRRLRARRGGVRVGDRRSLQPNGVTVVVLMGLGALRCDRAPADRPRLVARHAGGDRRRRVAAEQQVWRGTLDELAADARRDRRLRRRHDCDWRRGDRRSSRDVTRPRASSRRSRSAEVSRGGGCMSVVDDPKTFGRDAAVVRQRSGHRRVRRRRSSGTSAAR